MDQETNLDSQTDEEEGFDLAWGNSQILYRQELSEIKRKYNRLIHLSLRPLPDLLKDYQHELAALERRHAV